MVDMTLYVDIGLRLDFQLPLVEQRGGSYNKGGLDPGVIRAIHNLWSQ